ncbi:hypothetical protein [Ovoidimarina sediminis]|nr:hypothetical protein [Rhodophyticola sp. MJ-SS7]MDU8945605.1 hypothetical protein [Rhodophyticola sp. MJ-SS7]
MTDALTREDWERIAFALSHFRHNVEMKRTYDKVQSILSPPDGA